MSIYIQFIRFSEAEKLKAGQSCTARYGLAALQPSPDFTQFFIER